MRRKTREYIDEYFSKINSLIGDVPKDKIEQVVETLYNTWEKDAQVFIMGNGGSASTASHFACDLAKGTIIKDKKRFKVTSLVDNIPLVSSWTNDSGFGSVFVEQLRPWLKKDDVLIGISVHGGSHAGEAGPWSQNLVKAMKLAKERGANIIGFSGFDGGALEDMADICITIPINSEPLGTPLVESFHVLIHHLVGSALKQKIANS